MIVLRVLAVMIFVFGLTAAAVGLGNFLIIERSVAMMAAMREADANVLSGIDLSELRLVLYVNAALVTVIGGLSFVAGVGMFLKKNWARRLWIGTLFLTLAWFVYAFVMSTVNRALDGTDAGAYAVLTPLLVALLYFFLRGKTKRYFEVK